MARSMYDAVGIPADDTGIIKRLTTSPTELGAWGKSLSSCFDCIGRKPFHAGEDFVIDKGLAAGAAYRRVAKKVGIF